MSVRFESCAACHNTQAIYACDRCKAEIIGIGGAEHPFRVTVVAPMGLPAETHLCGQCAIELAKLGVSLLPLPWQCLKAAHCEERHGHDGPCTGDRS